ncbi:Stage II sporulation protein E (SpoIIE) [Anatilimnocola aggregata]|uniref:Stage II sporulation protein E (SpoIIE) n=1 Tax=Anatilimnocola aggregata TaxID=2528021 RepID=A0A517Y520_9BACT|nr:SpoIIE family protein phosphatase [Anatilimnocola aggregata]QDU25290.1 Stage II sporulation protein E (SpoIIE) [Anatilimnocola aggregata]
MEGPFAGHFPPRISVAQQPHPALRLHFEEPPTAAPLPVGELSLQFISEAFARATGWQLQYQLGSSADNSQRWSAPVDGATPDADGRLSLVPSSPSSTQIDLEAARPLALAIANLLSESNRLKYGLWQREAELAAGVPVAVRPNEQQHLAERLQCVLQGGAEAIHCEAAALYLLDETTSSLKLRAMWGLPQTKLLEPARPLRGAVADLEALVGHAVVLEDTSLLPHWRCPEGEFGAAVCVPVSTSSTPLGTLWIFSRTQREFTSSQTNLAEIIAGRLAADLEREMLLTVGASAKQGDKQIETAARWQQDRLPSVVPLLTEFEVSGWTQQARSVGGDFHDWTVLPDGRLALAVGDAQGAPLQAGLNAAAVQAAMRAHTGYRHSAKELVTRLNDTLWQGSAGDQFASFGYVIINPETGEADLALAGKVAALLIREDSREIFAADGAPLGTGVEPPLKTAKLILDPGECLVLLSEGVRAATDQAGLRIGEAVMAATLRRHCSEPAESLAGWLRRLLERAGSSEAEDDRTVLVCKRRGNFGNSKKSKRKRS